VTEGSKVERVGRRQSEDGCGTERWIGDGCLGLGATAGPCPGEQPAFIWLLRLGSRKSGGMYIGVAHRFIILGGIPRKTTGVYERYILRKGTSG